VVVEIVVVVLEIEGAVKGLVVDKETVAPIVVKGTDFLLLVVIALRTVVVLPPQITVGLPWGLLVPLRLPTVAVDPFVEVPLRVEPLRHVEDLIVDPIMIAQCTLLWNRQ
jgi:hypothetical protein